MLLLSCESFYLASRVHNSARWLSFRQYESFELERSTQFYIISMCPGIWRSEAQITLTADARCQWWSEKNVVVSSDKDLTSSKKKLNFAMPTERVG